MRTITLSDGDEELLADVLETFIGYTVEAMEEGIMDPEDVEITKNFLLDVMEFSQANDLLEFEGINKYEVKTH